MFRRASWDEALDLVAAKMKAVRDGRGGEGILQVSYGGSNGYLSQDTTDARLFYRLGASRLLRSVCAAPSGRAAAGLYGKMPGVAYQDYAHAKLVLVWGMNPSVSGIHLVPYILEARRRGAKLVVVDPRRTRLADGADLHLALRPGTDLPVALAMIRWLFENGRADRAFLAEKASGADELERRARPWTIERAARTKPVSRRRTSRRSRGSTPTRARPLCAAAGAPSATATAGRRSPRSSPSRRWRASSGSAAEATRSPTPGPGRRSTGWRPPRRRSPPRA